MFEIIYNDNAIKKKSDCVHYQKINILGDLGVGKTSLISLMENYDDQNFQIKNNLTESEIFDSNNFSSSLVEQIKKVEIHINEENHLYFNLYETNLDRYDSIKTNLDTLLMQTECIIIIWDKSRADTFDNIPNLIASINEGIKEYKFRNVPIFLIQNKIDLDIRKSEINEIENDIKDSIEKIQKEKNIICQEISLLEKDNFYELISQINKNMKIFNKILNSNINYRNPYLVKFRHYSKIATDFEIMDNNIQINCVLLGDCSVGKTTFFKHFYNKNENKNLNLSTISIESLLLLAEVNNEKIYVKISDTAGQERFLSISKNYIRNSDVILLFFDVTKKDSFDRIENWISIIEETIGNDSEIILIANKIDQASDRVIYQKETNEKASKYNLKNFECCCLNGFNLYEIIYEMILCGYYKFYEKNPNGIKRINTLKLDNKEGKWKEWKNYCWNSVSTGARRSFKKILPFIKKQ